MKMPSKLYGLVEDYLEAWKNSGIQYYLDYSLSLMNNYHDDLQIIELKQKYGI